AAPVIKSAMAAHSVPAFRAPHTAAVFSVIASPALAIAQVPSSRVASSPPPCPITAAASSPRRRNFTPPDIAMPGLFRAKQHRRNRSLRRRDQQQLDRAIAGAGIVLRIGIAQDDDAARRNGLQAGFTELVAKSDLEV